MNPLPIDYHLDDIDIFDGAGVTLPLLGSKARGAVVTIGQLTAWQWFYIYLPALSRLVSIYDKAFGSVFIWSVSSDDDKSRLESDIVNALTRNGRSVMYLAGILRQLGIFKGSRRRFIKKCLIGQLAEIFILLYAFNTEGLKKKLNYQLAAVLKKSSSSESSSRKSTLPAGYHKMIVNDNIKKIY